MTDELQPSDETIGNGQQDGPDPDLPEQPDAEPEVPALPPPPEP